jgi:hypothetical protein
MVSCVNKTTVAENPILVNKVLTVGSKKIGTWYKWFC